MNKRPDNTSALIIRKESAKKHKATERKENRRSKSTFAGIFILLSLNAFLLFLGCRSHSYSSKELLEPDTIPPVTIFQQNLSKSDSLNYSHQNFKLHIPANSLSNDTELTITRYPEMSLALPWQPDFVAMGNVYKITAFPEADPIIPPASLTLSSNYPDHNPNSIYVATRDNNGRWSFLSPAAPLNSSEYSFSLSGFSEWVLVQKKTDTTPDNQILNITASPTVILAESNGIFKIDPLISVSFVGTADDMPDPTKYQLKLNFIAKSPNSIKIGPPLSTIHSREISFDRHTIAAVNMFSADASQPEISTKIATSTIKLFLGNSSISALNDPIMLQAILNDPAGNTYSALYQLHFATKSPDPDPDPKPKPEPDPELPEISSVYPAADATGVAVSTVVALGFDRPMNEQSVENAFSLLDAVNTPQSGSFNWTNNSMIFTPAKELKNASIYRIILGTNAKSIEEVPISQSFSATFTTQFPEKATLATHSPASDATNVPFDEPIVLNFSAAMNTSELIFSISPAIAGEPVLSWNDDQTQATIVYAAGFSSNTLYSFTVSSESKDLFNQHLAETYNFSFLTETITGPRIIQISPASGSADIPANTNFLFEFDTAMNRSSVEQAILIEPATNAPSFSWNTDSSRLTVSFADLLAFSQKYIFSISQAALSAENLNLQRYYQISYKTLEQTTIKEISPSHGSTDISTDADISFSFSAPVNHASFEGSVIISEGNTNLPGQFTWNNASTQVNFTPASDYAPGSFINISFSATISDSYNLPVAAITDHSFRVIKAEPPAILSTNPAANATDVGYNSDVLIVFSEPMNAGSVNLEFAPALKHDFDRVWSADKKELRLSNCLFESETPYLLTIMQGAESLLGAELPEDFQLRFTSESLANTHVTKITPTSDATNIAINSSIVIAFSAAVAPDSIAQNLTFSPDIIKTLSWNENFTEVTVSFTDKLAFSTLYTVSVLQSALDAEGIELLRDFSSTFTTEPQLSVTVEPADGTTDVATTTSILLSFNKSVQRASVESAFRLLQNSEMVQSTFNWLDDQNLNIVAELNPGKQYSIIIETSATDINENRLNPAFSSNFTTEPPPAFAVNNSDPTQNANEIPQDKSVTINFSNPVDTDSLELEYSPVPPGGYSISWASDTKQLIISPDSHLAGSQEYEITIGASTRDIFSTSLTTDFRLNFTTAAAPKPTIISTAPQAGETGISLTGTVQINFDRPMNQQSVESGMLFSPDPGERSFSWQNESKTLSITFSQPFEPATYYQITIAESSLDTFATPMGTDYHLTFQTLIYPEIILSESSPAPDSVAISTASAFAVKFNKEMNKSSAESAFSLSLNSEAISGTFSWSGNLMRYTPATVLQPNSNYTVSVESSAEDIAGNLLQTAYNWSFQTAAQEGHIWELVSPQTDSDAIFSSRYGHSLIKMNNSVYLIGGYGIIGNDIGYLNDVWVSSDGSNWIRLLNNNANPGTTRFSPRAGHAVAVFNNRIWLTGGYFEGQENFTYHDDVWSSGDGTNWVRESESAEYFARAWHSMIALNNRLYMLAGETVDPQSQKVLLDDCWYSDNGINWTYINSPVSFTPRKLASTGVLDNKMWVIGGHGKNAANEELALNDLYYSSDGNIWQLQTDAAPFLPRIAAGTLFYNNRLWLIGGLSSLSSGGTYYNDVWATSNGSDWNQILADKEPSGEHFAGRAYHRLEAINSRIFITGGERQIGYLNEIWATPE